MPLMHGKSQQAFHENVKREIAAGRPQKQAVAIAYAVQRKASGNFEPSGSDVDPHAALGGAKQDENHS